MDTDYFCVIVGDPVSGIVVYGPFGTYDGAAGWATDNVADDVNFWVTKLRSEITMEAYRYLFVDNYKKDNNSK